MAVKLISDGTNFGLFNRLGKIFYAHERLRTAATNLATDLDNIIALYRVDNGVSASSDADLVMIDNLIKKRTEILNFTATVFSELQTAAEQTVIQMVDADTPLNQLTIDNALTELADQMNNAGGSPSTLESSALTTGSAVAAGSNTGAATVVATGIPSQTYGSTLEDDNPYTKSEINSILCTQDAGGGATRGFEVYSLKSGHSVANSFYTWPQESETKTTLTATNATGDASTVDGQNILTNGDMESFNTNVPNNWTLAVGTAGSTVFQTTVSGQFYDGVSALKFVGNGSQLMNVQQLLSDVTGTLGTVKTDHAYVLSFRVRRGSSQPTAGVLKLQIENVDDGSVLATANSGTATLSVDCTSGAELTTAYQIKTVVFRTKFNVSDPLRVAVEFTTALSNTHEVFVDAVCLVPLVQPAPGSLSFGIIASEKPFAADNDFYTITTSNNYGGKFFRELDRFFDTYNSGIFFPGTTGTATVADSLIA